MSFLAWEMAAYLAATSEPEPEPEPDDLTAERD